MTFVAFVEIYTGVQWHLFFLLMATVWAGNCRLSDALWHKANERKKITQSTHPLIDFYDIWVRKEAVLKAEGIGLLDGLDTVDCTNDFILYKNKKWAFQEIEVDKNYICYISYNHKKTISIYKSIHFTELFTLK